MKVLKRILAGLTFVVATVMLLVSLIGGVGVWIVKEPVTTKATHTFGRIDAALDKAEQGLTHVKTSLANAAERLETVKAEQQKMAREPRKKNAMGRVLARTVQQKIAPELGDAHQKFHTVAEAAVVVNSILEDMGNFPFLSVTGLDSERLPEISRQLSRVESAAWQLSRLLGEPDPQPDSEDANVPLSRIEQSLKSMQELISDYEAQLSQVRQRTDSVKAKTLPWITPATVIISLVCFWIALSQVSLLCHAWSWWRHSGQTPRPG